MSVTQVQIMPPLKLSSLMHSTWALQVLKTALELEIFSAVKEKGHKADAVAQNLGLDPHATKLILDALCSMELLTCEREIYRCNELSEAYLCKESHLYLGKYLFMREVISDAWTNLTDTVRSGKPQARVNDQREGEKFFQELTEAIFPLNYSTAQTLAEALGVTKVKAEFRVLDLAAGSAVWSLPMAQGSQSVKVDALDFPAVLEVTRKFATKFGVAERYSYLAGNWREIKLQPESYDVIILGHILHSEGKAASKELLTYCHAALKNGGTIAVAEFMENEDRLGPPFATLFAINMLLATASGCVFTVAELQQMLAQAGFKNVARQKLPFWGDESPIMVAQK